MQHMAESILDCACIVGESLVWDDRRQCLLWVDMLSQRIHVLDPESRSHRTWDTPEMVTSIGLTMGDKYVVGLKKRVALWDGAAGFETLVEIEPHLPDNRLNEGAVGPDGHFWVGTMQNNVEGDGTPRAQTAATGHLYRVSADGEVACVSDDPFWLTNTLVWWDGHLVVGDTAKNILYRHRIDGQTGRLSERQVYFQDYARGLPDGSCVDGEGQVWNCRVAGGQCVVAIRPDGTLSDLVETPCSWPTSCVFGGPDLDVLYIASARFTMDADHLLEAPWEGNLFAAKPGAAGTPCFRLGDGSKG